MLSPLSGKFHPQIRQLQSPSAPKTGNGFLKLILAIGIAVTFLMASRAPVFAEDDAAPASVVMPAE